MGPKSRGWFAGLVTFQAFLALLSVALIRAQAPDCVLTGGDLVVPLAASCQILTPLSANNAVITGFISIGPMASLTLTGTMTINQYGSILSLGNIQATRISVFNGFWNFTNSARITASTVTFDSSTAYMINAGFAVSTLVVINSTVTVSLATSANLVNFSTSTSQFHLALTEADLARFHKEDIRIPLPFLYLNPGGRIDTETVDQIATCFDLALNQIYNQTLSKYGLECAGTYNNLTQGCETADPLPVLSATAIVGVVIAVLLFICCIGAFLYCWIKVRKEKKDSYKFGQAALASPPANANQRPYQPAHGLARNNTGLVRANTDHAGGGHGVQRY